MIVVINPGPNDFTVLKIYISQLLPAQTPGRSSTPQSLGYSDRILSGTFTSPLKTFRVSSCPPIPFVVPPFQETELAISFTPPSEGFFSAILDIIPSAPQLSQQITLHGEGEYPSSPQQILYNVIILSKSKVNMVSALVQSLLRTQQAVPLQIHFWLAE
jgi:hypothetical protein